MYIIPKNHKIFDSLTYPTYSSKQRIAILFCGGCGMGFLGYITFFANLGGNFSLWGSSLGIITGVISAFNFDVFLYSVTKNRRRDDMDLPANVKIQGLDLSKPLRKHTAFIHTNAHLTVVSRKIQNVLYKTIYDSNDWDTKFYFIKKSDITKYLGRTSKKTTNEDLKTHLSELRKSGISWNIFGQDRQNADTWSELAAGETGVISGFLIIEKSQENPCSYVRFTVDESIKEMIREPNIYAFLNLSIQRLLKKKASLVWYEVFVEELCRSGQDEAITRWYSNNDIRQILGILPNEYKTNKSLFHKCITEAINEINDKTDIYVKEISPLHKEGSREIVAHQFKVSKKKEISQQVEQTSLDFSEETVDEFGSVELHKHIRKTYTKSVAEVGDLAISDDLTLMFPQDTANIIFDSAKQKYAEDGIDVNTLIRDNIEYSKTKKPENLSAYIRMAIENDYVGSVKKQKTRKLKEEQLKEQPQKLTAAKYKELIENYTMKEWDKLSSEEKQVFMNEEAVIIKKRPNHTVKSVEEETIWESFTKHLEETDQEYKKILSQRPYL